MPSTDPGPDDWEREAHSYLNAALVLALSHPRQVYVQAGTALECALKCRIMRGSGLNRWPSRAERREYYTHDLNELAKLAGLLERINEEIKYVTDIGIAWVTAKDFSMHSRYPNVPLAGRAVEDMLDAAGRLVPWILER